MNIPPHLRQKAEENLRITLSHIHEGMRDGTITESEYLDLVTMVGKRFLDAQRSGTGVDIVYASIAMIGLYVATTTYEEKTPRFTSTVC